ncbi:MAG TPA: hypothetical protein VG079_00905 [Gaiellaceae bacterium]|nr:hypothetical protein [Gaiellaceae bacterium]
MRRLRAFVTPVGLALRRMRARPLTLATMTLAIAGAAGLIGWSSLTAVLAQEENVGVRLGELPPAERSLEIVYQRFPPGEDRVRGIAAAIHADVASVTEPSRHVEIWRPIAPSDERGVRVVATADLEGHATVAAKRRPRGCSRTVCEALALAGQFRRGQLVPLGGGVSARVIGSGSLGPGAVPAASVLGRRAILVRAVEGPLARRLRVTPSTVVTTAPLDPERVHASELRALAERLRGHVARAERAESLVEARAPVALLEDIAHRGEVARARLLLVAGQGAALVLAFAAFAAAARRGETQLLDEQLSTLGASQDQVWGARLVDAVVPSALGTALALAGLRLGAEVVAETRGLPASLAAAALPVETIVAIVGVALAASALLLASAAPGSGSRSRIGALELAAATALAVVVWQSAATGALDPDRIAASERGNPVLLFVPALAFFATGVLLLRVVPVALRAGERLARKGSFGLRLAFLGAARNPAQAAAVTTFLAVALGVSLFSVNYRATLERQARDEASFAAGARWRVLERSAERGLGHRDVTPLTRFASISDERPAPVLRLDATLQEVGSERRTVEILALPARRLPGVLGWRDEFSRLERHEIARRLRPEPVRLRGIRLADDASAVRLWARAATRFPRFVVFHFLVPEAQRFIHVRAEGEPWRRWRRVEVPLRAPRRGVELVSVEFGTTFYELGYVEEGFVELGRLEQRRRGRWSPLRGLDDWTAIASAQASLDRATFARAAPLDRGMRFELAGTAQPLIRPALAIPAQLPGFVSGAVATAAVDDRVTLGVAGRTLSLRVVGTSKLFPSITERPGLFAVVDYDTLFAALNADYPGTAVPSEAWFFRPQSPGFAEALRRPPFRLESAVGVEPLTARLVSDPLAAGARSVLAVSGIVAAVVALLGLALATRSTLAAESALNAEYEALGVPPATLARSLQARLVALSLVGLAAGLVGGAVGVRLIGAFVAVTGAAARPLPPIEPVIAWRSGAAVVAAVGLAGVATAAVLAGRALRETAARRLRA